MLKKTLWRFIDTKRGPAYWNMAVDETLLEGYQEGALPILRLYGWEPSLSIGRFSTLHSGIDIPKAEEAMVPMVRRVTGGGVLVHGGDLSYTLIVPRDYLKNTGVKESYRHLCGFLLRLYEKLGHNASFVSDTSSEEVKSDICLAGYEAYDIVINGEKMGGNAQRYTRDVLFQHGSIPMSLDASRFTSLFTGDSGLERAAALDRLGTPVTYASLCDLVKEAFCETYNTELLPEPLCASEEERAKELMANKYTQKRWNYDGQTLHP